MKYYENDEFIVPDKYKNMSLEQLNRRCKIWEAFHKLVSKIVPSRKNDKLDKLGIKVNL